MGLTNFNIYPNPANNVVNISLETAHAFDAQLELLDATGRSILQKGLNGTAGARIVELDVSNLSSGIYSLNLVMEGKTFSRKVLVD